FTPEPERHIIRRALSSPSFVVGLCITLLILLMAVVSLFWTPYDVTRLVVADRMQGLSLAHPFGTDHVGRDILSMIMIGARNSIAMALVAVGIGVGIGASLCLWGAARGGWLGEVLMRGNDMCSVVPSEPSAILIC